MKVKHFKSHSGENCKMQQMWLNLYSGKQKCNQCHFACSDPSYLSKHLKSHSGEKSNKCNKCDFTSIRANNLRRCNLCNFACSDPSYLSKHLKSHSGEKSNKCNECDFTSIRANKNAINATLPVLIQDIWENIWNHTVEKSKINATNVTLALFVQTKIQSMRLCLFCLSKHLKSHIGKESNKCNECDFTSIRVNILRRHFKIHSGEK